MKIRPTTTGVFTAGARGHVALRAGEVLDLDDETARLIVRTGAAVTDGPADSEPEPAADETPKPRPRGKRVKAAPENKDAS